MSKLARSVLGHLRQSELRLAKSILRWKLQKDGQPMPNDSELDDAASRLLEEAREIAKQRGKKDQLGDGDAVRIARLLPDRVARVKKP